MKNLSSAFLMLALSLSAFTQDKIELSQAEKDQVAVELKKEAKNPKHDSKVKEMLHKVADEMKSPEGRESLLKRIGRGLGKGSAWVTTTTAKPFMNASGFLTGAIEKKDKNQDTVAMYKFILSHQKEFDPLYLEAGSVEDMVELMIGKSEEIMERKSKVLLSIALAQVGIKKEIPQDLADFELSGEDLAQADMSKLDIDAINNHPEYADVRGLLGDLTKENLEDIIMNGYFDKTISFENMKGALPKAYELVATVLGQIFVPHMVLGIVSNTLATLYVAPVMVAQAGTGVATFICVQPDTKEKFEIDQDLKSFCSYVTNRTGYQLMKSRAKGFVAGKKLRNKIEEKIEARKERRAEKRAKKSQVF